jgi:hypothetical protein
MKTFKIYLEFTEFAALAPRSGGRLEEWASPQAPFEKGSPSEKAVRKAMGLTTVTPTVNACQATKGEEDVTN